MLLCLTNAAFGMNSDEGVFLKNFIKKTITENESIFPFSPDYFETKVDQVYKYLENTLFFNTNLENDHNNVLNLFEKKYEGNTLGAIMVSAEDVKIATKKHIIEIYKKIKNENN